MVDPTPSRRSQTRWLVAGIAMVAALVVASGVVGLAHQRGMRWFDITSPSMGQAAPVGTLVVTVPVRPADVSVGDVISFVPPRDHRVFTHRVIEVTAAGFRTQGDINGAADPWVTPASAVIGQVGHYLYGVGFLLRGLPWLILGWLLVWLVSLRIVGPQWRAPFRVVGATLVVSLVSWIVRPWLGAELLTYRGEGAGVSASVVSTGILPIRASADGGTYADLVAGQVGVVHTDHLSDRGFFTVVPSLHMGFWWWVAVIAFCLLPLAYCLIVGLPPVDLPPTEEEPAPTEEETLGATTRLSELLAASPTRVVGVLAVAAALVLTSSGSGPTVAAFSAGVKNQSSTAGMELGHATCRSTLTGTAGAWIIYPFGDRLTTAVTDISGNGHTGTYVLSVSNSAVGDIGCVHDTPARSATFAGGYVSTPAGSGQAVPNTFSIETWFRTSATGAKLVGFGKQRTGLETSFDRMLYVDGSGRLRFGVTPTTTPVTVVSPNPVNDGLWHHAVATMSPAGMALYLDGVQVASNPAVTSGGAYSGTGWWRLGGGNLLGWPTGTGAATYPSVLTAYSGQLSYSAIYTTALTPGQVRLHRAAGLP